MIPDCFALRAPAILMIIRVGLNSHKLIASGAKPYLLGMGQTRVALRVGRCVYERISCIRKAGLFQVFGQYGIRYRVFFFAGVKAGLIKSYGIHGCEHTYIRYYRDVIFRMTVAVR